MTGPAPRILCPPPVNSVSSLRLQRNILVTWLDQMLRTKGRSTQRLSFLSLIPTPSTFRGWHGPQLLQGTCSGGAGRLDLRAEGRGAALWGEGPQEHTGQREWPPWHQHTVPPPRPAAWIPIRPIFPGYSATPLVAPPSERPAYVPKDRHIRGSLRQLGARAKHQN